VVACNPEELACIHPALRSRLRGFGYEILTADSMPRTPENEAALTRFVAQEVRRDGRIPHFTPEGVRAVIEEAARRTGAGRLTLRLRELGGLVRIAGDLATFEGAPLTGAAHVERAREFARSAEEQQLEAATLPSPRPALRTIPPPSPPGSSGAEAGGGG
jgi:ATP-dependent Lon protease